MNVSGPKWQRSRKGLDSYLNRNCFHVVFGRRDCGNIEQMFTVAEQGNWITR